MVRHVGGQDLHDTGIAVGRRTSTESASTASTRRVRTSMRSIGDRTLERHGAAGARLQGGHERSGRPLLVEFHPTATGDTAHGVP